MARHRVPASLIEIEITESAMMGDHDDILAELAQLMSNKPLREALASETDPAAVHRMLTTGQL